MPRVRLIACDDRLRDYFRQKGDCISSQSGWSDVRFDDGQIIKCPTKWLVPADAPPMRSFAELATFLAPEFEPDEMGLAVAPPSPSVNDN